MTTERDAGAASAPVQPRAISHLVLNVRDLERSHYKAPNYAEVLPVE